MIQKCNIYKVLKVFLDDPFKGYKLREISRLLKLGLPSVSKYVKELEKEGIIIKKNKYGSELYFGNRETKLFRLYKIFETRRLIEESGLIDFLDKNLNYPTIILYGSHALGEDRKDSDIDLFIVTQRKKELDIEKYEKIIGKSIHLFLYSPEDIERMKIKNKELLNNVINGIVLSGYFKVL